MKKTRTAVQDRDSDSAAPGFSVLIDILRIETADYETNLTAVP